MRTVSLYFPFFKTAVTPTFIYMNDNGEGEQQQRGNELSWPADERLTRLSIELR